MRNFTYCLCTALFSSVISVSAQQLDNNDFNGNWEKDANEQSVQPEGWNSLSWKASSAFISGMKGGSVDKGEDGSNLYPVITNKKTGSDVFGTFYGYVHPGILSIGMPWTYINTTYFTAKTGQVGVDGGVEFTGRPVRMEFKAKYFKSPAAEYQDDCACIRIYLWKGDCVTKDLGENEHTNEMNAVLNGETGITLIGKGELNINEDIENFTDQSVEIKYESEELPEKLNVVFSASNYMNVTEEPLTKISENNELCIDDVTLVYSTVGLDDHELGDLEVSVDRNGLSFNKNEELSVEVYDLSGCIMAKGKSDNGFFGFNFIPRQIYIININGKSMKVMAL